MSSSTASSSARPDGTPFVTSRDGTRIAYTKTGHGPPLIMVMGALGFKDFSFARAFATASAPDFTVINYDRRGRGESGDTKPYAAEREIEDIAALVQDAAGGSAYVWGTSSGAALALEAAAAGVPMRGLVAFEPPYGVGRHHRAQFDRFERDLQDLVDRGDRSGAVSYFMRTVGAPALMVAVMKLFPMWKKMKGVAHTLPYDAAVMGKFHVPTDRFARIRVPTLVATGGKSPPNLQDASRAVAAAVPAARHQVIPKQHHGIKPSAIAPVLVEAFKGTGPAAASGRAAPAIARGAKR